MNDTTATVWCQWLQSLPLCGDENDQLIGAFPPPPLLESAAVGKQPGNETLYSLQQVASALASVVFGGESKVAQMLQQILANGGGGHPTPRAMELQKKIVIILLRRHETGDQSDQD